MRFKWNLGVPIRPPVYIGGEGEDLAADDGNPFTTRRSYWKGVIWLLIALGAQAVAALMTEEVEVFYSRFLFYYITRSLSAINKFVLNYSLGEFFFALLAIWLGLWSLWYLRRSFRKETKLINVIKVFGLQILWLMSLLVPIFLALWGLNYQRLPLADTLEFDRRPARAGELESIGLQIVSGVNNNYEQARGSRDWNGASSLPITRDALFRTLERAFQNETLLAEASRGELSNPKPLVMSRLASAAGVSGFYIPFTGEVTFNEQVPAFDLPMVIAHHKAHQRGYAREDEANFIGYIVCINSTEPYVRYSGYLYGLKILETLTKGNPDRYSDLLSRVNEGPKADIRERSAFWERMKTSVLSEMARRTFSVYLRANRVHGGLKNYDEDVSLIISYYLKYPQRQLPATEQSPTPSFDGAFPRALPEPTPQTERSPDTF